MPAAAAKNEVRFPESPHAPDRHHRSGCGPDETTGLEGLAAASPARRGCPALPAGLSDRPRVSYKCRLKLRGLVPVDVCSRERKPFAASVILAAVPYNTFT